MNIVITGASQGIGLGIAEKFCADRQGHNLYICGRDLEKLQHIGLTLKARFPRNEVFAFKADLSEKEDIIAFAAFVNKQCVPDIIINNAGYFIPGSSYNEPDGVLESMLETNLLSAYYLTRMLLPEMMQAQSGHIFNMCSIASLHAYANGGAYSISKFALAGFTKNLREEMKPFGIKVTGIYPGATLTESWAGVDIDPKRIMEVNDIAEMVYTAAHLSPQAVIEDIILRPQLGDL